eukprot:CAMPEP_0194495738 /NCGR_PEP_ID=MMETSP0253-20130528/13236_1 /TAXON_ID=2966 /ORGANISM="Noctiluca scintillans" /LENGTH=97 /DNA_ID=CAMNT_0039337039 /DNA_START=120 /DNA_END=413 /DNA_ORIENTATION=-
MDTSLCGLERAGNTLEEAWSTWRNRRAACKSRRQQKKKLLQKGSRLTLPEDCALFSILQLQQGVVSFAVPEDFSKLASSSLDWKDTNGVQTNFRAWC